MEPTPPPPATSQPVYAAPTRGFAVASVSLGFFSMIVFWWKPFGSLLAGVGFILGVVSLVFGNRGGLRGENLALAGTVMCAFVLSVCVAINAALGLLLWGALRTSRLKVVLRDGLNGACLRGSCIRRRRRVNCGTAKNP